MKDLECSSGNEPQLAVGCMPAQVIDYMGQPRVDHRTILARALPLMAGSAIQVLFNLVDMWFIARISTAAVAAVGAIQLLLVAVLSVLGSGGMAVQPVVARSIGARRYTRAARATWAALWVTLGTAPLFVAISLSSGPLLAPFGFSPTIEALASDFWFPRVAGAPLGVAASVVLSFFLGIGQSRVIFVVTAVEVVINTILNQVFIFQLGMGVAGSAWATTSAQGVGLLAALTVFLGRRYRRTYKSHLAWRPHISLLWMQLRLGIPKGLLAAADIVGFSMFQMMQTRVSTVGGAASQVVGVLASIAYVPGLGIASASATLVGQSIGAGDRQWAKRLGTRAILLTACCTGTIGFALAVIGPWFLPLFIEGHDAESAAAVALGTRLLWVAAAYQFFDGLNLGSSMCLYGAADITVPALLTLPLSWLIFLPLAHSLTFAPSEGWFNFLPHFGWGVIGGWIACVIFMILLGSTLFLRWYFGAWGTTRI